MKFMVLLGDVLLSIPIELIISKMKIIFIVWSDTVVEVKVAGSGSRKDLMIGKVLLRHEVLLRFTTLVSSQ